MPAYGGGSAYNPVNGARQPFRPGAGSPGPSAPGGGGGAGQTPVGIPAGGGVNMQTQGQYGSGASFQSPTPNPYNLPDDLVGGQPQGQQFNDLLGQFEQSRLGARAANESRYDQALGGYQNLEADYSQRTQDLMGNLQGFGDAQNQALADKFTQEKAGLTQDMISRGLYNTTSVDQARQNLGNQQQRQQLQVSDMLMRQKMDYQKSITGEELANRPRSLEFIERRNDIGPSYQDVAGVSGAVGAGQAGVPDYLSALGASGRATSTGVPQNQLPGGIGSSPTNIGQLATYRPPQFQNKTSINVSSGTRAGPSGSSAAQSSSGRIYGSSGRPSSSGSSSFGNSSLFGGFGGSQSGGSGGGNWQAGASWEKNRPAPGSPGATVAPGPSYGSASSSSSGGGGGGGGSKNLEDISLLVEEAGLDPSVIDPAMKYLAPYMTSGRTLKDLSYDFVIRTGGSYEVQQILDMAGRSN